MDIFTFSITETVSDTYSVGSEALIWLIVSGDSKAETSGRKAWQSKDAQFIATGKQRGRGQILHTGPRITSPWPVRMHLEVCFISSWCGSWTNEVGTTKFHLHNSCLLLHAAKVWDLLCSFDTTADNWHWKPHIAAVFLTYVPPLTHLPPSLFFSYSFTLPFCSTEIQPKTLCKLTLCYRATSPTFFKIYFETEPH